jgi:hypothetical protein
MGISRNTLEAALASDGPPKYVRARGAVEDSFEPRVQELRRAHPAMPATVIAEPVARPYLAALNGAQAGVPLAQREISAQLFIAPGTRVQ